MFLPDPRELELWSREFFEDLAGRLVRRLTPVPGQMPNLIEDALTSKLAAWLDDNRPEAIPATVPIHVANRDELRTRPCIVLATSDTKPVSGMRHTARIKLDVHLFTQVDDTPADDHAAWACGAGAPAGRRGGHPARTSIDDTFCLHDLLAPRIGHHAGRNPGPRDDPHLRGGGLGGVR